jgi:hypothetical protein
MDNIKYIIVQAFIASKLLQFRYGLVLIPQIAKKYKMQKILAD